MLSQSYDNAPFAACVIAFQIQNKFGLKCFHETILLGNSQIGQDGFFQSSEHLVIPFIDFSVFFKRFQGFLQNTSSDLKARWLHCRSHKQLIADLIWVLQNMSARRPKASISSDQSYLMLLCAEIGVLVRDGRENRFSFGEARNKMLYCKKILLNCNLFIFLTYVTYMTYSLKFIWIDLLLPPELFWRSGPWLFVYL